MKKKKSEPPKYTVSFSKEIPTQDEFVDKFIALAKLACDIGIDKDLKSEGYNDDDERVEEKIRRNKLSEKFLNGLEKRLREDKEFQKLIDKNIAKRKLKKKL